MLIFFLTGCGMQPTFEKVTDVWAEPEAALPLQAVADIPADAVAETMEDPQAGRLYMCDGYTVTMQTLPAGDIEQTLRSVTGYSRDKLTVLETAEGEYKRYDLVWASAGEGEEAVGRAAILDDGNYHYVLAVLAEASAAGKLMQTWREILGSFRLE